MVPSRVRERSQTQLPCSLGLRAKGKHFEKVRSIQRENWGIRTSTLRTGRQRHRPVEPPLPRWCQPRSRGHSLCSRTTQQTSNVNEGIEAWRPQQRLGIAEDQAKPCWSQQAKRPKATSLRSYCILSIRVGTVVRGIRKP